MTDSGRPDPAPPSPEVVTAARRHLTGRYADGVDRLLWELEKRLMPDPQAVGAVLHRAGEKDPADALDIGAALVLVQAMRLEVDAFEADVLDTAHASGMSYESVAAVLDLPTADAAERRHRLLRGKRDLPRVAGRTSRTSSGSR